MKRSMGGILVVYLVLVLALTASVCVAVPTTVYNDLIFYLKYASSAYTLICPQPNGKSLVNTFKNILTETQGFVARDDGRKEIVVALRGSLSVTDIITDASLILTPFISPGVAAPWGTLVHSGFLLGWNSVSLQVLSSVGLQLRTHPGYSLVTSGHSLGGALASLAAMSLKANFPSTNVTLYTYGQPRTGNSNFADWVNSEIGNNVFRAVHTFDGVPTIIPTGELPAFQKQNTDKRDVGYRHHGVEYWQNPDPASENSTRRCAEQGEDPECSASIPSTGVNIAHLSYFGIPAITPFCLGSEENTVLSTSLPSIAQDSR